MDYQLKNIVEAGYRMLIIMSIVDGHYATAEGKVCIDYLSSNWKIDVNVGKENNALLSVSKDRIPEAFSEFAKYFYDNSTEEERLNYLSYQYRLIMADGRLAMEEVKIFSSLCISWNIDPKPILSSNLINSLDSILK